MRRETAIGLQNFGEMIEKNCFYVDKTAFIREWWESKDAVTLITRPRRFGKTLTMSMVEHFFSVEYKGKGELFHGLKVWEDEKYRSLQGTYPVINLSFAGMKENTYLAATQRICHFLTDLYNRNAFLLEGDLLNKEEKVYYHRIMGATASLELPEVVATMAVNRMSEYLYRAYGKKVIILLDEYDTPMQEAYVNGYWSEMVSFVRNMFHSMFKTNPYMERGILTGITRISKESIFSDLNNLKVVTTTSDEYADCFGFTQEEVYAALEEYGLSESRNDVKFWYDGFTFGKITDIYNPWSVLNFLDTGKLMSYWANTSSNHLIGKLIREGSSSVKLSFEELLKDQHLKTTIDEQIVYQQLDHNEYAIWSLLLASGYLKVVDYKLYSEGDMDYEPQYELALTNFEVKLMFRTMVREWFGKAVSEYNGFVKALLSGNVKAMNQYMNRVALATFSYFDTGKNPSQQEPERFYHGFVLGLLVELGARYVIQSNRESGFGRYDVLLEPKNEKDDAIILEFKVHDPEEEETLSDTVAEALRQIEEQGYAASLISKGIPMERIRQYGFAFEGKKVQIG